MATTSAPSKLSQQDWIVRGLDTLRAQGIRGVRVEPMARELGVTKGSFYWHFKDHDDFLQQLLEYWETEMTDKIDAQVSRTRAGPGEHLLALCEHITYEETNRYDAAMRAWALYDARAASVVRRVDQKRLRYARALFLEMGFSERQADIRSRLSYFYMIGERAAFLRSSSFDQRLQRVRLRHKLLTER
jgi:AcrR family transcriptional regulator